MIVIRVELEQAVAAFQASPSLANELAIYASICYFGETWRLFDRWRSHPYRRDGLRMIVVQQFPSTSPIPAGCFDVEEAALLYELLCSRFSRYFSLERSFQVGCCLPAGFVNAHLSRLIADDSHALAYRSTLLRSLLARKYVELAQTGPEVDFMATRDAVNLGDYTFEPIEIVSINNARQFINVFHFFSLRSASSRPA